MDERTQPNQSYTQPTQPQQPPPPSPPQRPVTPTARQQAPKVVRARRRRKQRGCMPGPGCLLGCFGVMGGFTIVFLIAVFVVYSQYSALLEDTVDDIERRQSSVGDPNNTSGFETTIIYDRNGNRLFEVFDQGRRQRIPLEEMPETIIQATISLEDDDFYNNVGFDVRSNVRAAFQYVQQGAVFSGGSTITQQLVRNVLFEPEYRAERTVVRKLDEIARAFVLTQEMEKDDILELYLNEIYYGNLAYGIEAAAQTYFGKSANELELHESALLAALPQLPAELDPLNPDFAVQENVRQRQHLALDLMVKEEYITEQEAAAAKLRPLNYVSPEVPLEAPHFTLYAQSEMENILLEMGYAPEFIRDGGFRVYTTVDLEYQQLALEAARDTVNQLRTAHNLTNASVVIVHPPSGEILAMVGSIDYDDESIDGQVNVAIAQRQPGSTMKPFTYAAMMEQGWSPGTILWDTEARFGGQPEYVPQNYDRRFHGPVRLRDALANSYNIPAVQAMRYVGVDYLLSFFRRMGTTSFSEDASNYGLSLTLGGGDITLLEMTTNYATLARQGIYIPSTSVLCIVDRNDNIIYQYENRCEFFDDAANTNQTRNGYAQGTPVIDPRITFIISDILSDNAARTPAMGSNSPLNTGTLLTSVKTGTTDNFRDNWTVGYTRDIAIGVWSGNSDNTEMVNISGLAGAAPIWQEVMLDIYTRFDMPPSVLTPPAGVTQQRVCNVSAMRDPVTDCPTETEWFLNTPPLIPDGQGNLVASNLRPQQPPPQSEFGPRLNEIEPGIYEVAVRPLDPGQADLVANQNSNVYAPPRYCLVPIEVLSQVPDAQNLRFFAPPDREEDLRGAYRYSSSNNIPILPAVACDESTIQGGYTAQVDSGVTLQITSPTPGQVVSGNVPIYGVVRYPAGYEFVYYKLEVRGGQWENWTTLGDVHYNQVNDPALLETFQAESVPPGTYELQLWAQGDLYVEPYRVSITLVAP